MRAVLTAAREEFSAKGYHAATIDAIALRAGVSKRTIYFWHADKAALFHACVIDGAATLSLPQLDSDGGWRDGLLRYASAVLRDVTTDYATGMARLLTREGRDFPEVARAIEQGERYLSEPVARVLRKKGLAQKDATRLAKLFVAMLMSDVRRSVVLGRPAPDRANCDRLAKLVVRTFLNGLADWL
jgi:TetR/AcrR family transcriptional regulator, mexJK operon transcriptional repressor